MKNNDHVVMACLRCGIPRPLLVKTVKQKDFVNVCRKCIAKEVAAATVFQRTRPRKPPKIAIACTGCGKVREVTRGTYNSVKDRDNFCSWVCRRSYEKKLDSETTQGGSNPIIKRLCLKCEKPFKCKKLDPWRLCRYCREQNSRIPETETYFPGGSVHPRSWDGGSVSDWPVT